MKKQIIEVVFQGEFPVSIGYLKISPACRLEEKYVIGQLGV